MSWKIFAVGSAAFAALTAIFGKIGVGQMNSDLATFLRTLVVLLVGAVVLTLRAEWQRPDRLSPMGIAALVLSGIATGLSWLCYFRALQLAPASRVAPIDKLSVVFVVIFGAMFLGEPVTWRVGVGAACIALGAIIMVV